MRTPKEVLSSTREGFVGWLDRIAEDGLLRLSWWRTKNLFTGMFGRRMVARKLIPGERVIREVMHSKILYIVPGLVALFGLFLAVRWLPFVAADDLGFPLLIVASILGYALYKVVSISRDRFVITDSRVFRVWGVFTLNEAEMEIVRVLDITVLRPWYLRPFATGHVILENAAQEQGLREIRVVPYPEVIAMDIHRRRRQMMGLGGDDEGPTLRRPPPTTGSRRRPDHPRRPGPITARRR
jgi:Bacterial PH domain